MTAVASPFAGLERTLGDRRRQVDAVLVRHFEAAHPAAAAEPRRGAAVAAAARDSLEASAKRVRPVLTLLVADVLGAPEGPVLPAACAVEMVHTASLILDDLPSMDDARVRRGRPTCHRAHGEAVAILAAFALQNRAFQLVVDGWEGGPGPEIRTEIARELSGAIGMDGMVAGQAVDLGSGETPPDCETLEFIHSRKTGALFTAAASIGALMAGAAPDERNAVRLYAKHLGLAFQIADDLIDVECDEDEAGKDVGKDRGKVTFVSLRGARGADALARELAESAESALGIFGERAGPLRELARYAVRRRR